MKFRLIISGNGDEKKVRQIAGEARAYMEGEKITVSRATLQSDGKPDSDIAAAETHEKRPTSQTSENTGSTVTDAKPTGEQPPASAWQPPTDAPPQKPAA